MSMKKIDLICYDFDGVMTDNIALDKIGVFFNNKNIR